MKVCQIAAVLLSLVFLGGCQPDAGEKAVEPIVITDANFEEEVLSSGQPVLMDCWAPWCGPCLKLGPTIDEIAREYAGRVKVGKLNVDDNPNIARELGISSIPAVFVFRDGKVAETLIGVRAKQDYIAALKLE